MKQSKTASLIALVLTAVVAITTACAAPSAGSSLITPEAARTMLSGSPTPVLLDVRTAEEFSTGYIAGAVLLPYDQIDAVSAPRVATDKSAPVIVYCRSGRRSAIAASTLVKLGYKKVFDLGGIASWPYGTVTSPAP